MITNKEIDYLKTLVKADKNSANFLRGFREKTTIEKEREKASDDLTEKLDKMKYEKINS